ncbi:MAG: hypothetical protein KDB40_00670 [Acidimicrobiales bacterium]|nr:hypothetical protein [Acidimicrobiales bacterium]MCB9392908.1 hypothetical protein [Acidimicrobiaceae bacterium]
MSFVPPPPPPGGLPGGEPARPRSTPIPGDGGTPPTTAQFLDSLDSSGAPVGAPSSPFDQPGFAPPPGGQYTALAPARPARGAALGIAIAAVVVMAIVGGSVFLVLMARGEGSTGTDDVPSVSVAASGAEDLPSAASSPVPASEVVPLTAPTAPVSLFEPGPAAQAIDAIEQAVGVSPSSLLRVVLYPEYVLAQAQSATEPANVDAYDYRRGEVDGPDPVVFAGPGDLASSLYSSAEVDWTTIAALAADAVTRMPEIEEPAVTHVIVERSVFDPSFSVTIRVYVNGPRHLGGYAEYTPGGELIQVQI